MLPIFAATYGYTISQLALKLSVAQPFSDRIDRILQDFKPGSLNPVESC